MNKLKQKIQDGTINIPGIIITVSYTHLDVYKRQASGSLQNVSAVTLSP